MSVSLSIHQAKNIGAYCFKECGTITIEVNADGITPHQITVFTHDHVLNQRLVAAINRVVKDRHEEKTAAGKAAEDEQDEDMFDGDGR